MRIAICGTRGIPACYGGFETFAEQLSTRLVARGHEVVVYGRRHVIDYREPEYRGVKLKLLWAPRHKYLETPVHSLLSLIDLTIHRRADVVLLCNAANSPFLWIPRLRGIPVVINVDGIERLRAKWNSLGKLWYALGERCAARFAPKIVSDAEVIRAYYETAYRRESTVIAYGYDETGGDMAAEKAQGPESSGSEAAGSEVTVSQAAPAQGAALGAVQRPAAWLETSEAHRQLGIEPGKYLLYVSRLEPENNAHVVIAAYAAARAGGERLPLVIVGDAPYAKEYIRGLKESAGPGVIFAGYRFGEDYRALQLGAYLYIQATEVGGTHPALVEAMGFANCILANGTPENREVVADAALVYPKNDVAALAQLIGEMHERPDRVEELRRKAYSRARRKYCWDVVCDQYEALLAGLKGDQGGLPESEKMGSKVHFDVDNAV